jgi:hypothetical protein
MVAPVIDDLMGCWDAWLAKGTAESKPSDGELDVAGVATTALTETPPLGEATAAAEVGTATGETDAMVTSWGVELTEVALMLLLPLPLTRTSAGMVVVVVSGRSI